MRGLFSGLAPNELHDGEQDNCTNQAGEEAEDDSTVRDVNAESAKEEATEQAANDANNNVEANALLGVGALNLGGDPACKAADDNPADNTEWWHDKDPFSTVLIPEKSYDSGNALSSNL